MDADDAVDILEQLPEEYRDLIVEKMDEEAKEDIELITSYEDNEIGSMMTTNFVVIERGLSVKAAMKELIRQSGENDNISTIYVTEPDGVALLDVSVACPYTRTVLTSRFITILSKMYPLMVWPLSPR